MNVRWYGRAIWCLVWTLLAAWLVFDAREIRSNAAEIRRLEGLTSGWDGRLQRWAAERDAALAAATQTRGKTAADRADISAEEAGVRRYLGRIEDLQEVMARVPDVGIPEMRFLTQDDWIAVVLKVDSLQSNRDFRRALAAVRQAAKQHVVASIHSGFANYPGSTADIAKDVHDLGALASYFHPPLPPEILQRYEKLPPGTLKVAGHDILVREKDAFAVDREFDALAVVAVDASDLWVQPRPLPGR